MTENNGSNVSVKSGDSGNTIIRVTASKKWVFTLNNYTKEEEAELVSIGSEFGRLFYGHEIGDECKTPHLQGFIIFHTKTRPIEKFKCKRYHWEKMKSTILHNLGYCSKGENIYTNDKEWLEWLDKKQRLSVPTTKFNYERVLRPWQKSIIDMLDFPDDRSITWIADKVGGKGKSILAQILVKKYKTIVVNGGKKYVLSTIYKSHKEGENYDIIIFDLARTCEGFVSYESIEKLKDGLFFSGFGTDGTGMCCLGYHPHIFVFANFEPDMEALSADRWNVKHISNENVLI